MTEYYIAINGKQQGPFSIDELKKNKLERETLVWIKGMDEW